MVLRAGLSSGSVDTCLENPEITKKPVQKKRRAQRNAARRKMTKAGKVRKGDGKDVDHKDRNTANNKRKNLRVVSKRKNRSYPRKKK